MRRPVSGRLNLGRHVAGEQWMNEGRAKHTSPVGIESVVKLRETAGLSGIESARIFQQNRTIMDIQRAGSRPSSPGPGDWFTGTVRIDPLFGAPAPARVAGASVTFEPGARTAWHTHPLGQTLIVTAGCGRAQREGGPIEEIRPGDVIWFPPGEKHWHGAAPTTAMTHIAIQENLDGKVVEWMEKVTDAQYNG